MSSHRAAFTPLQQQPYGEPWPPAPEPLHPLPSPRSGPRHGRKAARPLKGHWGFRRYMIAGLVAAAVIVGLAVGWTFTHQASPSFTWQGRTYDCASVNAAPWFTLPPGQTFSGGQLKPTYPLQVRQGCFNR